MEIRQAVAAWNVSGRARDDTTVLAEKLIVMRIVDHAIENVAGPPREASLALGAPHLVASVSFEDPHMALGTRARVLVQEFDCIHILLLALVILLTRQPLVAVALGTDKMRTQPALPSSRETPPTLAQRTRHEKLSD